MAGGAGGVGEDAAARVLAERLRVTLGQFVRRVKAQAGTPTTSQSETLLLLEQGGPLSVAELAARRQVRHQSMRLVTGQLEAEGLVETVPHPADRRSRLLSITGKGRESLALGREARSDEIAALIEARLKDEERRVLEEAIRIIERLC